MHLFLLLVCLLVSSAECDVLRRAAGDETPASPGVPETPRLGEACAAPSDCQALVANSTCADGVCACGSDDFNWKDVECRQGPEEFVVVTSSKALLTVPLNSAPHRISKLPATGVRNGVALDYDPQGNAVFWTDVERKRISRITLDGTGLQKTVVSDLENPDGLAVDWMAGNLYWTDTGTKTIEVSRLDGTSRLVLISRGLLKPRAIALDPAAGHMYWTDWGSFPSIERAALDGTGRTALVTTKLRLPNGLALDLETRRVYWCDAGRDRIESISIDGSDRRVLIGTLQGQDPHYFGVSLLGDFLYWTDWESDKIERAHKVTGDREVVVSGIEGRLSGLRAVSRSAELGTNPCSLNNGGCRHLCLNTPAGPVCRQVGDTAP